MDLTSLDRLCRKRNLLLQRQLDVRLQIIQDEYRMTKKDMEKNSEALGEFLLYLRQTAPGLNTYGQPDTRAMNSKNILLERRYTQDISSEAESPAAINKDQIAHLRELSKKSTRARDRKDIDKSSESSKKTEGKSSFHNSVTEEKSLNVPPKNEFFNRRIVLDSRRRSFLQRGLNRPPPPPSKATESIQKSEEAMRLARPSTQPGMRSDRSDKKSSAVKRPQSAAPKYGKDAEAKQYVDLRNQVLERFDVIFDPQNDKNKGRIRREGTTATPIYLPKENSIDLPLTIPEHDSPDLRQPQKTSNAQNSRPGYILNKRVAWSAPPKRREDPVQAVANANGTDSTDAAAVNRQNQSVTPRSGTANMVALNKQYVRPHSTTSAAPHDKELRDASLKVQKEKALQQVIQQHFQKWAKNAKRPKTAPSNYELRQRTMSASRQQVAGILAEIQSRRADTRAMLYKSKQIKQMVKDLAPPDQKLDDSFSD